MADLPESAEWSAGVYQLETSDPVLGGPDGIDNLQAKQLASRTLWLKDAIADLVDGTTPIGAARKLLTPRAISISGAATGIANFDGSANVNIALTLQDVPWAKIVSGKPTTLGGYGITDAFTKPETNAAIQQAIENFSGTMISALAGKANKATTLAGYNIGDTYTKPEIEELVATASALPIGSLVPFPVSKLPPGFLELNGDPISIAAYPDLYACLGTAFNDGSEPVGYFRLPESRGEFLRGWDHNRGVDAGRALGSWQAGQIESHSHGGLPTLLAGKMAHDESTEADTGVHRTEKADSTSATGGNETRPRNLAVMWCIKAWNARINQGNIDVAALAALVGQATEATQGTLKIGSSLQVKTGTNHNVAVTPKTLSELLIGEVVSGITMVAGAQTIVNHTLGIAPRNVDYTLVCVIAQNGWVPGDVIHGTLGNQSNPSSGATGMGVYWYGETASQITIGFGNGGWLQPVKGTGARATLTLSNFTLTARIKPW